MVDIIYIFSFKGTLHKNFLKNAFHKMLNCPFKTCAFRCGFSRKHAVGVYFYSFSLSLTIQRLHQNYIIRESMQFWWIKWKLICTYKAKWYYKFKTAKLNLLAVSSGNLTRFLTHLKANESILKREKVGAPPKKVELQHFITSELMDWNQHH